MSSPASTGQAITCCWKSESPLTKGYSVILEEFSSSRHEQMASTLGFPLLEKKHYLGLLASLGVLEQLLELPELLEQVPGLEWGLLGLLADF